MLLNIRRLQDPFGPRGLYFWIPSVLCLVCWLFLTTHCFQVHIFYAWSHFASSPSIHHSYIWDAFAWMRFAAEFNHARSSFLPLSVCRECILRVLWAVWKDVLEMQHTVIKAARKFQDNQPSNSGNLTRLSWHITLMNGKYVTKRHRAGELHLLCRLLECCWWNLWL